MNKRQVLTVGRFGSIALSLILATLGSATAEDQLRSGFVPDPLSIAVTAGGSEPAGFLNGACNGWVSGERPNHRFQYEASRRPLGLYVEGNVDTTLVVQTPSGEYFCNDDFSEESGRNPAVQLESPETGIYSAWVGTYKAAEVGAPAMLAITELDLPWSSGGRATGNPDAVLRSGFMPDPHEVGITVGGEHPAYAVHYTCAGYVASEEADYSFEYHPGRSNLSMYVQSYADTTLVVQTPSGAWACNDDLSSERGRAPGIHFDDPEQGTYKVWVGTYSMNDSNAPAILAITERGLTLGDPSEESDGSAQVSSSGTGFFASEEGHLLTNLHVVDGCSGYTVQRLGEGAFEAVLASINKDSDLALLKIEVDKPVSYGVFRSHPPLRLGEETVVLGFSGGDGQGAILTSGVISALSGYEGNLQELQHTAEVRGGSSGSAILDSSGHIIGVVTASLNTDSSDPVTNVNFGTRGSIVQVFLAVNNVPYKTEESGALKGVPDITENARQFTVIVNCHR